MQFFVGTNPKDSTHYSKMFGPDNYQEEPPQVIGNTLSGKPVRQGYRNITFLWTYINQDDFSDLMDVYNLFIYNGSLPIPFTYIDKATGQQKTMTGMMHEPLVGMRQFVYYANVAVRMSHCEEFNGPW